MRYTILRALFVVPLFFLSQLGYSQAPTMGTAANFVLFTTNGAMTNSGVPHLTHLTGNVGSNLAGSVTGFGNVDGQMHTADVAAATCAADVNLLYNQINTATSTFFPVSPILGNGATLVPGVYQYPLLTAASLNLDLTLDGQGDPNALFIIKIDGAFSTNPSAKVKLINGALACNVFWKVEGMVNMASGTTMRGNIVAHNAAINMSSLDTLEGRALSINGAVTTNSIMAYKPIGCGSTLLTGPAAPTLVATAAFGVFSSIGAVSSTPVTYVTGDVGSNSTTTTGFNPLNVTGIIHTPPDVATGLAASDLTLVYNYLNAVTADIELLDPSNFGYDLVLTPHTYHMASPPTIALTGSVYLDAQGNPNAVFIIQMNGAFTTSTLSRIMLINGTQAKNVYWKIDGATHIFDNSVFNGTIVGAGAITLNTGDTLNGRALTINGAIAINGSYLNNNPSPCVASPITGSPNVCQGGTTTLADSDTGGTWSSSNPLIATVGSSSGIVSGVNPGIDTVTYTSGLGCVRSITITVNAIPNAGVITGPSTVCAGSTIVLSNATSGGVWSSTNATATVVGGTVTGVTAGIDTIKYTVTNLGCSGTATKTVTVNAIPNAGTITGSSAVCVGSTIVLTNATSGGVWSSTNATATVVGGTVTGVTAGIDTIKYTVTNLGCTGTATKTVTVNAIPNAGTITGPSTVCAGTTIVLTNATSGGVWSSTNATATVVGGTVTGVTAGTDTIKYAVTNLGCTGTATKTVTVNPLPNAGAITGPSNVCAGSSITLTNAITGGIWSSSNATATVVGGTVTGVTAGIDTISYAVSNSCGTSVATKIVTIDLMPNAGVIAGPSAVCEGSSIVLTDAITGGTWSSSNAAATVTGGTVTGISAGVSTISYTVTNGCGSAFATKTVTINAIPGAGTISGASSVCAGSSIVLTNATTGGVWSSTNATATVVGGTVTGVTAGTDTIKYTVTNLGCTGMTTKTITVNPLPNAGVVTGPSNVCAGSTITLVSTITGGVWSSSNATATVVAGTVTGVTAGIDTISYAVSNSCGTSVATKIVTIDLLPNAGVITGASAVCEGSSIVLTDAVTGGVWSSSNATATVASGTVTGVTAGTNTISYTTTNGCGSATTTKVVTINALPNAGTIIGASQVCAGSSITLTNAVTGGSWTSSNSTATVTGGIVNGITAGIDTIRYTVTTTGCSASTTKTITVNAIPNAGTIAGASSVCIGASTTLTNATGGGIWSMSNTAATVAGGVVTGVSAGTTTVSYTVTSLGCSNTATKTMTVNTLPTAGTISGPSAICIGSAIALTGSVTGGTWSTSNATATFSSGIVTGVSVGIDTISYAVSNACGTATAIKIIAVNALPAVAVINISSPSSVCMGTMYQNFGTPTLPPASTTYNWSATNATVWAQGTGNQNAVINFDHSGTANVILTAANTVTGCTSTNSVAITVGTTTGITPTVTYFSNHFVCTPDNMGAYQWGYDNKYTLDSTILSGEINQDYVNGTPDFANKLYWVMTTTGGCSQKTYYASPLAVANMNTDATEVTIYPNPASATINVMMSTMTSTTMHVDIINMTGQKMSTSTAADNKASIDISLLPAGSYVVIVYKEGVKVNIAQFIKN